MSRSFAASMLATLTDLGYVVITATSGEEALEKFRTSRPTWCCSI